MTSCPTRQYSSFPDCISLQSATVDDDDNDNWKYKHTYRITYHTDERVNICSDKKGHTLKY